MLAEYKGARAFIAGRTFSDAFTSHIIGDDVASIGGTGPIRPETELAEEITKVKTAQRIPSERQELSDLIAPELEGIAGIAHSCPNKTSPLMADNLSTVSKYIFISAPHQSVFLSIRDAQNYAISPLYPQLSLQIIPGNSAHTDTHIAGDRTFNVYNRIAEYEYTPIGISYGSYNKDSYSGSIQGINSDYFFYGTDASLPLITRADIMFSTQSVISSADNISQTYVKLLGDVLTAPKIANIYIERLSDGINSSVHGVPFNVSIAKTGLQLPQDQAQKMPVTCEYAQIGATNIREAQFVQPNFSPLENLAMADFNDYKSTMAYNSAQAQTSNKRVDTEVNDASIKTFVSFIPKQQDSSESRTTNLNIIQITEMNDAESNNRRPNFIKADALMTTDSGNQGAIKPYVLAHVDPSVFRMDAEKKSTDASPLIAPIDHRPRILFDSLKEPVLYFSSFESSFETLPGDNYRNQIIVVTQEKARNDVHEVNKSYVTPDSRLINMFLHSAEVQTLSVNRAVSYFLASAESRKCATDFSVAPYSGVSTTILSDYRLSQNKVQVPTAVRAVLSGSGNEFSNLIRYQDSHETQAKKMCEDGSNCFLELAQILDGTRESDLTHERKKSLSECYGEQLSYIQKAREYARNRKDVFLFNSELRAILNADNLEYRLRDYVREDEVQHGFSLVDKLVVKLTAEDMQDYVLNAFNTNSGKMEQHKLKGDSLYAYLGRHLRGTAVFTNMGFIDADNGKERTGTYTDEKTGEIKSCLILEAVAEYHQEAMRLLGDTDSQGTKISGIIILINGEELGQGTTSLWNYQVKNGDLVEVVYKTDKGVYRVRVPNPQHRSESKTALQYQHI